MRSLKTNPDIKSYHVKVSRENMIHREKNQYGGLRLPSGNSEFQLINNFYIHIFEHERMRKTILYRNDKSSYNAFKNKFQKTQLVLNVNYKLTNFFFL